MELILARIGQCNSVGKARTAFSKPERAFENFYKKYFHTIYVHVDDSLLFFPLDSFGNYFFAQQCIFEIFDSFISVSYLQIGISFPATGLSLINDMKRLNSIHFVQFVASERRLQTLQCFLTNCQSSVASAAEFVQAKSGDIGLHNNALQ